MVGRRGGLGPKGRGGEMLVVAVRSVGGAGKIPFLKTGGGMWRIRGGVGNLEVVGGFGVVF